MSSWGCEEKAVGKRHEQAGALVEGPSGDRGKGWKVSLLDVKLGCGAGQRDTLKTASLLCG